MAEQPNKSESNSLDNIISISAFEASHRKSIFDMLEREKKKLESAKSIIAEKREKIVQEEQSKREQQIERERLEKVREEEIKAALAVSLEVDSKPEATPTESVEEKVKEEVPPVKSEEKTAESVAQPVEEQPKNEKSAVVEKATATVGKKENKSQQASVKQGDKKVDDKEQSEFERRRKEQINAITDSIFGKPQQKPAPEKPVIRVFIPPVEVKRPPKKNREENGNNNNGFNRNNNTVKTQGGKPIFDASVAMPPISAGGKKKQDGKVRAQVDEKATLNKKARSRYEGDISVNDYDENGEFTRVRTRKTGGDKRNKNNFLPQQQVVIDHAVIESDNITIKALSEKIGKTGVEIIKQLFLLGIIKTINDSIDFDTADLVAGELGITLELKRAETSEEKVIASHEDDIDDPKDLVTRPPIVTIMGHVDHGKTSILDYIRNAHVAAGEAGGITQHIGAYSITVQGHQITFIDTPGHAAFAEMRARGANVTDIAIIVVAADDGIMPQTIEAINHAKAAGVQIIVAVNKMDKPTADPDRIMTALTEFELVPEEWGGTVPVVKVSAKTGAGIQDLLETILINAEVMELKANPNRLAKGAVIEAKLDKGKGPMATILVQNGTLKLSDYVVAGSVVGKIRAMQDDKGRPVKKAGPSMAVSVLGLQEVPCAGDQLLVVEDEKTMKEVADLRSEREKEKKLQSTQVSLDDVFKNISEGKLQNLNLIIKADVQGSVEAIKSSMVKLSNDEVKVNVVHAVAGAINESDVMLADTTKSIIIGFNVRPDSNAKALAEKYNIDIRMYRVIYDALDDVENAIKGLLAPKFREEYIGKAEIRVVYKISGVGSIAGCMVKDGKIARNAKARLIRDDVVICETSILSLKRMKDDVKEVIAGYECGIGLNNFNDIKEGDIIESFNIVQE